MSIETFLNRNQLILDQDRMQYFYSDSCPKLIKGVSGSGKSTLMLYRSAYLIEEGYSNKDILNILISKEAIKQCEKTFKQSFAHLELPQMIDIYSFAYFLIKKDANIHRKTVSKAYKELTPLITRLCKDFFQISITKEQAMILQNELSLYRNAGAQNKVQISKIEGVDLSLLSKEYQAMKQRKAVWDYDDILWECIQVLRGNEALLQHVQMQYKVIHVDDAQEWNYPSHVILNMIKGNNEIVYFTNSEYSFLPLEKDNVLLKFNQIYPEGKIFLLEGHYRCDDNIWKKACEFKKIAYQESLNTQKEADIKCKNFMNLSRLYEYAESKIQDDKEIVFLYRHYAMAIPLVDRLEAKGIAYQFQGNVKHFIQDKIVTDLWNFIELLIDPCDIRAFYEVYKLLGLDISKRVLVEISERIQSEEHVDIYHALMESSLKSTMKQRLSSMIENIRYAETLTSEEMIEFIIEKLNYGIYLKIMNRSAQDPVILALLTLANAYPKPDELLYRLSQLQNSKSTPLSNVIITSMERVQGLEFNTVYVLDCIKGIIPRNDDVYERDLFYHAMTRAKKGLEFFTAKQVGTLKLYASPYLYEIQGKVNTPKKAEAVKKKLKMSDLKAGTRVQHINFGEGTIKKVSASMIQIAFKEEVKVFNTKICIENQWLQLI